MTTATLTRPLPAVLADLRLSLLGEGWTATSSDRRPDNPEAERLYREEAWT